MTTRFTKLGLGPTAGKQTPALALHELWRFVCGSIWEYALFAGRHFAVGATRMKLSVAAIILFCSIATSFAGNLALISKNKIAQNSCAVNCQIQFDICTRLRGTAPPPPTVGTQQVSPPTVTLPHGPQCEADRDFCTTRCTLNPRG